MSITSLFNSQRARRYRLSGVDLEITDEIVSPDVRRALEQGWYEQAEIAQLHSILQPNEVVLEIGAGIGLVSTVCAKDSRVKAVHAYEANPALIDLIRRTLSLNQVDVTVHHAVLGKENGQIPFYLHESFWASSLLKWDGAKEVMVPMVSFQEALERIRPSLIVCDIEGGELGLFDGIRLDGVRKILMELHQNVIGREGMRHVFQVLHDQCFHYDQWHSSYAVVLFSHVDRDKIVE
jgi:FkbM family methyltransferase